MLLYRLHCEINFSAAHRLIGHRKCGTLHGHNYKVEIFVVGKKLQDGMLIDFHVLKQTLEKIKRKYDHKCLNDFFKQPTAEILAKTIFVEMRKMLQPYGVKLEKVRVWETENLWAEYNL